MISNFIIRGYACHLQYSFAKAFYFQKKIASSKLFYVSTFSTLMRCFMDDWKYLMSKCRVNNGMEAYPRDRFRYTIPVIYYKKSLLPRKASYIDQKRTSFDSC